MTEQEQMNELIDKVHQWGVDRKIIGNGKLETQWLKLLSEFGEMCDTIAKGGDPIDDIGDQLVVLIMMAGIAGIVDDVKKLGIPSGMGGWDSMMSVSGLNFEYGRMIRNPSQHAVASCIVELDNIAVKHGLSYIQCLEHAYDEIKDRKGYLNEHGVFIKE